MQAKIARRIVVLGVFCWCSSMDAQVVTDTHITMEKIQGDLFEYYITIQENSEATESTCNFLVWDNGDVKGTACLDGGADWFVVDHGDEFSKHTVRMLDESRNHDVDFERFFEWDVRLMVGDEFYAGIATPIAGDAPVSYGWAQFRVVDRDAGGQGLEMIRNAMAYNEDGIYVGTTRVVPEPKAEILFTVGLALFLRMLRKVA